MSDKKVRITYDIEPELLAQLDRELEKRQPIRLSRNNFISLALEFYLNNLKGDKKENEKVF
jgi:metal-responsive CopG/Arc/MetJ family transcriptional regulator